MASKAKRQIRFMTLRVESLVGKHFEITVYEEETVFGMKYKIQQAEGIFYEYQHLIYQGQELLDYLCLHQYGISDGCTVKLVLAMQVGPMNTKNVIPIPPQLEQSEGSAAERIHAMNLDARGLSRDGSSSQLGSANMTNDYLTTLLMMCEGEQISLSALMERMTVEESPSFAKVASAAPVDARTDDQEESEARAQRLRENDATMQRMKQLRSKMETMSLSRKPKKKNVRPSPPSHTTSAKGRLPRTRRSTSSSSGNHQPRPKHPCRPARLPPVGGTTYTASESSNTSGEDNCLGSTDQETAAEEELTGAGAVAGTSPWQCEQQLQAGATAVLPSQAVMISPGMSTAAAGSKTAGGDMSLARISSPGTGAIPKLKHKSDKPCVRAITSSSDNDDSIPAAASVIPGMNEGDRPCQPMVVHHPIRFAATTSPAAPSTRITYYPRHFPCDLSCTSASEAEAGDTSEYEANFSSYGGTDSTDVLSDCPVPATYRSTVKMSHNHMSASIDELAHVSASQPVNQHVDSKCADEDIAKVNPSPESRVVLSPGRLPPVKSRKGKARKCCFWCGKKTGLATAFTCRCGLLYCMSHRYPEAHECTYDYRSEGRKLLAQNNPLVSAPKLPKI